MCRLSGHLEDKLLEPSGTALLLHVFLLLLATSCRESSFTASLVILVWSSDKLLITQVATLSEQFQTWNTDYQLYFRLARIFFQFMSIDIILYTSVNEAEKCGHMEQDGIKVSSFAKKGNGFESFLGCHRPHWYTWWRTKCHTTDCTHNTFLFLQKHLTSGTELILIGWKIVPNESL